MAENSHRLHSLFNICACEVVQTKPAGLEDLSCSVDFYQELDVMLLIKQREWYRKLNELMHRQTKGWLHRETDFFCYTIKDKMVFWLKQWKGCLKCKYRVNLLLVWVWVAFKLLNLVELIFHSSSTVCHPIQDGHRIQVTLADTNTPFFFFWLVPFSRVDTASSPPASWHLSLLMVFH